MNRKTILSVLVVLALVLSMMPTAVFARTINVSLESPRVEGIRTRSTVASPTLASGNHVRYIDRIASAPDYVGEFYDWLVDNSTADGVLADPTKATNYGGEYYHAVMTVTGSASYNFTTQDEAVATGSALAQEALAKEFENFTTWAGVAWDAFDRDHPEVFWLNGKTSYSYLGGVNFTLKGSVCTVHYEADMVAWLYYSGYDIRDSKYRTASAVASGIQVRDNAIADILAGCPTGSTYDRVVYLNDALTARNAYNSAVAVGKSYNADSMSWKCISALEGRSGNTGPVCEGYARAFQVLCNKLQIPCVLVDGYAVSNLTMSPESHMWNYVQIDGGWYAVDVTWNDPYVSYAADKKLSGSENHKWLLLGSDTQVAANLNFLTSHEAVNQVRSNGPKFTNGPVLESQAYEPNANKGFTVSGTVSSANAGDVTVQLWKDTTLVSSATVSGTEGSYTFEGVAADHYQLTYIKEDHATFTQTLTLENNAEAPAVKLRLMGDVSGDGRVNIGDVARVYGHIKKSNVVADAYILLCMDLTGDGRINVGDTARLYAKIRTK